MQDRFGRTIDYLRVSVTDRCQLRCAYCAPPGRLRRDEAGEILSGEEIAAFVAAAAAMGFRKVRLTGGEPLLRPDVAGLVRMLARIPGIEDLALTTNGVLLEGRAAELKAAGLHRVNVSLDSLDPGRYAAVTGGGELGAVIAGIDEAIRVGLTPLKINCVILDGVNDGETGSLREFGRERGAEVRFIQRMKVNAPKPRREEHLHASRPPDCAACSRLRLAADGTLRPCLLSDIALSLRSFGADHSRAIEEAVSRKPECGGRLSEQTMITVGG